MAYGDFKVLAKRIAFREKAFNAAKNPKYDGYQRGLASTVYNLLDKKSTGGAIKSMPSQQLANELHKPIIRKLKKRKYIRYSKTIFGVLI